MEQLLEPFVGRRRRPELQTGDPCRPRGRLFAELAESLRRAFETRSRSRKGVDDEAGEQADDDGLDSRLEQPDPGGNAEDRADDARPVAEAPRGNERSEEGDRDE